MALDERVPATSDAADGADDADADADAADAAQRTSRFEPAPPRHFVLPAILLLLSEEPGYGYRLVKDLAELHFGRIDRPTVYRALGQLETDALVESWLEAPSAGQTRRIYGLTPLGGRVLRAWMGVVKLERDGLDRVLRRYQATGTVDAALAEIDGGWAALRSTWSPVAASAPAHRRRHPPSSSSEARCRVGTVRPDPHIDPLVGTRHFRLVPARSLLLVDVRSSVGPISFGTPGVQGVVEADMADVANLADGDGDGDGDGVIRPGSQPTGHVEVALEGLRSGNTLYDAELLRRIDARRFPTASIDIASTTAVGANRYRLAGTVSFHGVTRDVEGTVGVDLVDGRLVVTGEQAFDIRDFDVPSPTVLMLRIYPDVRVRLHIEASPVP